MFRNEDGIQKADNFFHSPEDEQEHGRIKQEVQGIYAKWKGHTDYADEDYQKDMKQTVALRDHAHSLRKKPWEMNEEEFHHASHTDFLHANVAEHQRGEPEEKMLDVQRANGG